MEYGDCILTIILISQCDNNLYDYTSLLVILNGVDISYSSVKKMYKKQSLCVLTLY